MEDIYRGPQVYRPLMASVMAGIIATVLNMFYDVIFRESTGFSLPDIINVSTIIFATMLILAVAGSFYALLLRYIRQAQIVYIIIFVGLTIYFSIAAMHTHRSPNPVLTAQFRDLLLGIVLISGISASFLVPYFTKSDVI